jgi:hypothetical protein
VKKFTRRKPTRGGLTTWIAPCVEPASEPHTFSTERRNIVNLKETLRAATPLPWAVRPTGTLANTQGNVRFIGVLQRHGNKEADDRDRADAALLQTAVNELPEAVEIIEKLIRPYEQHLKLVPSGCFCGICQAGAFLKRLQNIEVPRL